MRKIEGGIFSDIVMGIFSNEKIQNRDENENYIWYVKERVFLKATLSFLFTCYKNILIGYHSFKTC